MSQEFETTLPTDENIRMLGEAWQELQEATAIQDAAVAERVERFDDQNIALDNLLSWSQHSYVPFTVDGVRHSTRNLEGQGKLIHLPSYQEGPNTYSLCLHCYTTQAKDSWGSVKKANAVDFYIETIDTNGVIKIEHVKAVIDKENTVLTKIIDSSYLPEDWKSFVNTENPTDCNPSVLDTIDNHLALVEKLQTVVTRATEEAKTQPDKRNIREITPTPPLKPAISPSDDRFGVYTADTKLTVQSNEIFERLYKAAQIIGPMATYDFVVPKTVPPVVLEGVMHVQGTHLHDEPPSSPKRRLGRKQQVALPTEATPLIAFESRVVYKNGALGSPNEAFIQDIGPLYRQLFKPIDADTFTAKTGKSGKTAAAALKQALQKVSSNSTTTV